MEPTQALIAMAAGIAVGILNNRLLQWCGAAACRTDRRGKAAALVLGGYAARYLVIIAIVFLLARYFALPTTMLFLAGMLFATLGMAVFWRGKPLEKPAQQPAEKPADKCNDC